MNHCRITTVALCATILFAPNGAAAGPKENADAINDWLKTRVPRGFRGQVLLERDGLLAAC